MPAEGEVQFFPSIVQFHWVSVFLDSGVKVLFRTRARVCNSMSAVSQQLGDHLHMCLHYTGGVLSLCLPQPVCLSAPASLVHLRRLCVPQTRREKQNKAESMGRSRRVRFGWCRYAATRMRTHLTCMHTHTPSQTRHCAGKSSRCLSHFDPRWGYPAPVVEPFSRRQHLPS